MPTERTTATLTLLTALFASVATGLKIITSDAYLWVAAPTHAYGLMGFIALDAILMTIIWRKVPRAGMIALALATIQLLAMGGDLSGLSLPSGAAASGFTNYLLSDISFVVLLALQPVIIFLGGMAQAEQ